MTATAQLPVRCNRFRQLLAAGRAAAARSLVALLLVAPGCLTPNPGDPAGGDPLDPNPPIVRDDSDQTPAPRDEPGAPDEPEPQPDPDPLPAGAIRVVALGDSVTEGTGDPTGRGYPGRLLDQLAADRPGTTMLNLGKYGWTSSELVNGLDPEPGQLDAAVAAEPDVACVWIGSNDMWQLYEFGPDSGTTAAAEQASLDEFAANMDTIVDRLTRAGARVYVGLLDDQSLRPVAEDRFTLPNTTAREFEQMSALVDRFNQTIREVAERYDATTVDFYDTTIFTSDTTLDPDGIHPNAAGYGVIADLWLAAIDRGL